VTPDERAPRVAALVLLALARPTFSAPLGDQCPPRSKVCADWARLRDGSLRHGGAYFSSTFMMRSNKERAAATSLLRSTLRMARLAFHSRLKASIALL
jgi:hypothetical protein